MEKGLTYVFTGDGKGKTSAALGVAVRGAMTGGEVCWISWYKGTDWGLSEKSLSGVIANLEMYFMGKGFHIKNYEKKVVKGKGVEVKVAKVGEAIVIDTEEEAEHKKVADIALKLASEKIESQEYFVVVLDEVLNAIGDGLVDQEEVISAINRRGKTHVVLTGRGATQDIIEIADLVTECKKIKHPFDKGQMAVKGLDY